MMLEAPPAIGGRKDAPAHPADVVRLGFAATSRRPTKLSTINNPMIGTLLMEGLVTVNVIRLVQFGATQTPGAGSNF